MSHPLGNLLRHLRTVRGHSLRSLASRMKCSGAYLSKIEVGKSAPSDPAFLRRFSDNPAPEIAHGNIRGAEYYARILNETKENEHDE